jgi:ubiquinone/menaquinone biosynthesis C-methylase UbiE/uncharacterized protein YbaR (Trm112 family)
MKIDKLIAFLKCPYCDLEELTYENDQIVCPRCQTIFDVRGGVPIMVDKGKLNDQEKSQMDIFDKHYLKNLSDEYSLAKWQESMIKRVFNDDGVKTYLDIGCSADAYTVIESAKRKGYISIGMNLSYVAMRQAKRNADLEGVGERCAFVVASAERLPFRDSFFDYISLLSVLEHIKNDEKVIRGVELILKKEGQVYICVPNSYSNIWPFLWPIYFVIDKFVGHIRHYSDIGLNRVMYGNGFILEEIKYNAHLKKLVQIILDRLNLINSEKWWKIEEDDINDNSRGLQLNAIYKKR